MKNESNEKLYEMTLARTHHVYVRAKDEDEAKRKALEAGRDMDSEFGQSEFTEVYYEPDEVDEDEMDAGDTYIE